jgi:hypothetical protein
MNQFEENNPEQLRKIPMEVKMKAILIDELVKDQSTTEQVSVTIEAKKLKGWQIAKPLNYEKKYTRFIDRFKSAFKVLTGKAIAVQFFTDLSEEEKIAYVKTNYNETYGGQNERDDLFEGVNLIETAILNKLAK